MRCSRGSFASQLPDPPNHCLAGAPWLGNLQARMAAGHFRSTNRRRLESIHQDVNGAWTVESLAVVTSMSRSAFAARFKDLPGQTPLEYVTEWRMQKALQLLKQKHKKLVDVAQSVGYESDAAFSKAFQRVVGFTPGEYRHTGGSSNLLDQFPRTWCSRDWIEDTETARHPSHRRPEWRSWIRRSLAPWQITGNQPAKPKMCSSHEFSAWAGRGLLSNRQDCNQAQPLEE